MNSTMQPTSTSTFLQHLRLATIASLPSVCAVTLMIASQAAVGATAIPGVSCGGGFFAMLPGTRVAWIKREENLMLEVYTGKDKIIGMVECGTGVTAIFRDQQDDPSPAYSAYFSPDCRSIGTDEGQSKRIYHGKEKIVAIERENEGIVSAFDDGTRWRSAECRAPLRGPSAKQLK